MLQKRRSVKQWSAYLSELDADPAAELTLAEYTALEAMHACARASRHSEEMIAVASELERIRIKCGILSGRFERLMLENSQLRAALGMLIRRLQATDAETAAAVDGVYRELQALP